MPLISNIKLSGLDKSPLIWAIGATEATGFKSDALILEKGP
jgi:hypothetical protein